MGFRIDTLENLDPVYKLRERFSGTRAVEMASDAARVIVFDGDAELELLDLDWRHLDKQLGVVADDACLGVVVCGNLVVTTSMMNFEMDYGPFLYVRGSMTVGDIATAGSEVEIDGDLTVARTLFGYYNHGRMLVRGKTRAEYVAVNEHSMKLAGGLEANEICGGSFLYVGERYVTRRDDQERPDRKLLLAAIKQGRSLL